MRTKSTTLLLLLVLMSISSCRRIHDLLEEYDPQPHKPVIREIARDLSAPIGIDVDKKGQVWVTEIGTGKNDGKVSVIALDGKTYPVIEGFNSAIGDEGLEGLTHLLLQEGTLWILHGEGKLYKLDITSFQPGDAPMQASQLHAEDIGSFVVAYDFKEDTGESHIYNLTEGPDGDLYIADAGANAIIRRKSQTGALSVFATVPSIPNSTSVGPPMVDAVPTGIVYDGHHFFVSTLLGFPFTPGKSRIYQFDLNGNSSIYQDGLTSLVDIELGIDWQPVVLQHGTWNGQGFAPKTGKIVQANKNKVLLEGLNLPTDLERSGVKTYYATSLAEGKVLQITL